MNVSASELLSEFQNPEYRRAYVEDFQNTAIATQIKVLREQRGWSQADLAQRCEMAQSRISLLENVNYSSWSVSTLRRIAAAFDVVLNITFVSFENYAKEIAAFSRAALEVLSFGEGPVPIRHIYASEAFPIGASVRSQVTTEIALGAPGGLPPGILQGQHSTQMEILLSTLLSRLAPRRAEAPNPLKEEKVA